MHHHRLPVVTDDVGGGSCSLLNATEGIAEGTQVRNGIVDDDANSRVDNMRTSGACVLQGTAVVVEHLETE